MALSLPRTTRTKLVEAIASGLSESRILSGALVLLHQSCWTLHKSIPAGSRHEQELRLIAGEHHVTDFVRSEVSRTTFGKWDKNAKATTLELFMGEDGCRRLSESLVTSIESLPWSYKFYSELAGEFEVHELGPSAEVKLTPKLRLVSGKRLTDELETDSEGGPQTEDQSVWAEKSIYVEISLEGFVASGLQSVTVQDATDFLFTFYGLALSLNLVQPGNEWINVRPPSSYILGIFRTSGTTSRSIGFLDLDPSHTKAMHDLGTPSEWNGSNGGSQFIESLSRIAQSLSHLDQRVLTAARWLFDSHCGSNLQVRFVQIATAFEILLGDREQSRETGLSTLMANRCAYMLGRTEKARREICNAFRQGYDIRSSIVHTGKTRLSSEELGHFHYMQRLCALVIQEECKQFFLE